MTDGATVTESQAVPVAAEAQPGLDAKALTQELIAKEKGKLKVTWKDLDPVKPAVEDLVKRLLDGKLIPGNLLERINSAVASIDKLVADQVNVIIHNADFRSLEGTWRGLKFLVDNTHTDQSLKIRVMNISKAELGKALSDFSAESGQGGWDVGPIFRQIFERRLDQPGAEPFGCLVGDYQFDAANKDVDLLARLARICSAAHAPFISSASPGIMGLKSWVQLPDPASLAAKMAGAQFAKWRTFRNSEDSRYVALTVPRFLAREPYSVASNPEEWFAFDEDLRPPKKKEPAKTNAEPDAESEDEEPGLDATHDNYVWSNAAYAAAVNIGRSFYDTGFCASINGLESGGMVQGLPLHTFPNLDGILEAKCPTEVAIPQRREAELARLGFMPLSHYTGTDYAAFIGAATVQKPAKYPTSDEATANAALSAGLPYIFLLSRFSHYFKKMVYDWVGSPLSREQLEGRMNTFVKPYVCTETSSMETKAKAPFSEVRIEVRKKKGMPGYYEAIGYFKPHIKLEGMTISLGVVENTPPPGP